MSATDKLNALLTTIDNKDTNETKENKSNNDNIDKSLCMKWNKDNIKNYSTFIFDCDGVVWLQSTAIPGAKEVLNELVSMGKQVIFLSNNSTKDIKMYTDKFLKLFDLKVEPNQIFTSAVATASYLSVIIPKLKKELKEIKILLIGSQGLYNMIENEIKINKFENVSIVWTRKDIENFDKMSVAELTEMKLDENIGIVVAGWDHFYGYKDIALACRYLNENVKLHEMHLIGTNDDQTFPAKPGILLAGTGSLLASIKAVSPIEMKVCGKPHKLLFDLIKSKHPKIDINKCLMVGDRLTTDIVFGINSGMKTALVMTGITTDSVLKESNIKPTFVLPSIRDLL